jgi:hypothetical protein
MKQKSVSLLPGLICSAVLLVFLNACDKDKELTAGDQPRITSAEKTAAARVSESVLLVIDEESIDNGSPPNSFSNVDVNDQLARVGLRQTLRYFGSNVGKTIDLFTGEVGDEGWHALKTIPSSWKSAGPASNGSRNYLLAGPGLGGGEDNKEVLLDKIPNVTPLRATGLKMLIGKTVLAVVYDGDAGINYGPLNGNLMGANLGLVALQVVKVTKRFDGSSGSLPRVTVKVIDVNAANAASLKLFSNAPVPRSSSEPFDITPPATAPAIKLVNAP